MNNIKFKKYKLSWRADMKNRVRFLKLRIGFFVDEIFKKLGNNHKFFKTISFVIPVFAISVISYNNIFNESGNGVEKINIISVGKSIDDVSDEFSNKDKEEVGENQNKISRMVVDIERGVIEDNVGMKEKNYQYINKSKETKKNNVVTYNNDKKNIVIKKPVKKVVNEKDYNVISSKKVLKPKVKENTTSQASLKPHIESSTQRVFPVADFSPVPAATTPVITSASKTQTLEKQDGLNKKIVKESRNIPVYESSEEGGTFSSDGANSVEAKYIEKINKIYTESVDNKNLSLGYMDSGSGIEKKEDNSDIDALEKVSENRILRSYLIGIDSELERTKKVASK